VRPARDIAGVDVLAPDTPGMAAAITSFRFRGRGSRQDNDRIVTELRSKHGIFTVRRTGLEYGDCVRITPSLYNTLADLDRLVAALRQLSSG
jgi:isopenicillin-N epimerase